MSKALLMTVVIAILATNQRAGAILITHNGATTIFHETYEGDEIGSNPGPTNPGPGTWSTDETNGDASTYGPASPGPGAFQGSQYGRYQRSPEPPGSDVKAFGFFASSHSSGTVHAEWMMYIPAVSTSPGLANIFIANDTFGTFAGMRPDGAGNVFHYNSGVGDYQDTGINYLTDIWQRWTMTWTLGSGQATYGVAGSSATLSGTVEGGNAVSLIRFTSTDTGGEYFIDAIPEPAAALSLLALALTMAVQRGRVR